MNSKTNKTPSKIDSYIENSYQSENTSLLDERKVVVDSTETTERINSTSKNAEDDECSKSRFETDYNTPMIIRVNKYRLYKKGGANGDNLQS